MPGCRKLKRPTNAESLAWSILHLAHEHNITQFRWPYKFAIHSLSNLRVQIFKPNITDCVKTSTGKTWKSWAMYHDLHPGFLGLNEWQLKWSPKIDEKNAANMFICPQQNKRQNTHVQKSTRLTCDHKTNASLSRRRKASRVEAVLRLGSTKRCQTKQVHWKFGGHWGSTRTQNVRE